MRMEDRKFFLDIEELSNLSIDLGQGASRGLNVEILSHRRWREGRDDLAAL